MFRGRDAGLAIGLSFAAIFALLTGPASTANDGDDAVNAETDRRVGAPERILISGHSLTAAPFPAHLAAIGLSAGHPTRWSAHNPAGSNLRDRAPLGLPGADGAPHDALIVTEQHSLLGNIVWNDTIRHLRQAHDRSVVANPHARTMLFSSWLAVSDLADPARWIAYERAAAPLWECAAHRVNRSLAGEGRRDRVRVVPTALALATLVERATAGTPVPGLTGASTAATLKAIFRDDVHLTSAGTYYTALVTHAYLRGHRAEATWSPDGVETATAASLRSIARRFVHEDAARLRPRTLAGCRRYVARFVPVYLAYQRDTAWRDSGFVRANLKWARHRIGWPVLFARRSAANPFYYDAASDRDYWLPITR
ncbi:hypothetical protein M0208_13535 [Sphingomonas sp. SUN019]|uniref:hypothetical protein n=1 Tax=Sphingomonas sp. SUN019 TaxID=2937788 RepID=UPI002164521F|nr:hypothetical protein [Sphingomonas sp. SUN019]UVO51475.1 hypothetical protein M0208_13535 [Sphingomonas sp. SUN019]